MLIKKTKNTLISSKNGVLTPRHWVQKKKKKNPAHACKDMHTLKHEKGSKKTCKHLAHEKRARSS
jgi:hypothetical protein